MDVPAPDSTNLMALLQQTADSRQQQQAAAAGSSSRQQQQTAAAGSSTRQPLVRRQQSSTASRAVQHSAPQGQLPAPRLLPSMFYSNGPIGLTAATTVLLRCAAAVLPLCRHSSSVSVQGRWLQHS